MLVQPADEAFCAKVLEGRARLGDLDPSADAAAALAGYQKVLGSLAAAAPPSIKPDVDVVNQAVQGAATWQALTDAGTPAVRAASERLDEWATTHCGSSLGPE